MLIVSGNRYRLCDRLPRRTFLQVGGLGLLGLSLPDVLQADQRAGRRGSQKSVIMVFLPGGPSHIDLFDLKPHAPSEIRGEFSPIATNVRGIELGELLPRLAQTTDKLAILRTIVGGPDDHASHMCLTGYERLGPQPGGGRPSIGPVVSKLLGPREQSVPPAIDLSDKMIHGPYNDPGPGFLGVGHAAFRPDDEALGNLVLNGISSERLADRRTLLEEFDRMRRVADADAMMAGMDSFQQRAFGVIMSPRMRNALDLSQEDPSVRRAYGPNDPSTVPEFNAAPKMTDDLLAARRLVEAGARCVTVSFASWDWHTDNFNGLRQETPYFDRGLAALVDDLHARGLDRDVLVVAWGEFGRSPRVNQSAGRDHWAAVSGAIVAGGGIRGGQTIGSTNRLAETPKDRPVHFLDVFATIYAHLGIDTDRTTIMDFSGRPQYLVGEHRPIPELYA